MVKQWRAEDAIEVARSRRRDIQELVYILKDKLKDETQPTAEIVAQLLAAYRLEMDLLERLQEYLGYFRE